MRTIAARLWLVMLPLCVVGAAAEDKRPFCKTVPQAAEWVLANVPSETTLQIARMPPEALINLHFGLGMWIRNNVPVWGNPELIRSAKGAGHPDDVGGMILRQYWQLSRKRLPAEERERIELFENFLRDFKGTQPEAASHRGVVKEINSQIQAGWPRNAKYPPFKLRADSDIRFTWEPSDMTADLGKNVGVVLTRHHSMAFYDGDLLRIGRPRK